jgi:DNA polymerase
MGALEMGIDEDDLPELVQTWRRANPHIVKFWKDVERATLKAVKEHTSVREHGITFAYKSGFLFITLPSGRKLAYVKPQIGKNRFGSESVSYEGVHAITHQWEAIETFGGKSVENCIQAIARDLLQCAMFNLSNAGYSIVASIHDEVIIEAPLDKTVEDVVSTMCKVPDWFEGFPLRADGYECMSYRKE